MSGREAQLEDLLKSAYLATELERAIARLPGGAASLQAAPPARTAPYDLFCYELVHVLARRSLVNGTLFSALLRDRPYLATRIRAVASAWDVADEDLAEDSTTSAATMRTEAAWRRLRDLLPRTWTWRELPGTPDEGPVAQLELAPGTSLLIRSLGAADEGTEPAYLEAARASDGAAVQRVLVVAEIGGGLYARWAADWPEQGRRTEWHWRLDPVSAPLLEEALRAPRTREALARQLLGPLDRLSFAHRYALVHGLAELDFEPTGIRQIAEEAALGAPPVGPADAMWDEVLRRVDAGDGGSLDGLRARLALRGPDSGLLRAIFSAVAAPRESQGGHY